MSLIPRTPDWSTASAILKAFVTDTSAPTAFHDQMRSRGSKSSCGSPCLDAMPLPSVVGPKTFLVGHLRLMWIY